VRRGCAIEILSFTRTPTCGGAGEQRLKASAIAPFFFPAGRHPTFKRFGLLHGFRTSIGTLGQGQSSCSASLSQLRHRSTRSLESSFEQTLHPLSSFHWLLQLRGIGSSFPPHLASSSVSGVSASAGSRPFPVRLQVQSRVISPRSATTTQLKQRFLEVGKRFRTDHIFR
jgi:hypothetical protein